MTFSLPSWAHWQGIGLLAYWPPECETLVLTIAANSLMLRCRELAAVTTKLFSTCYRRSHQILLFDDAENASAAFAERRTWPSGRSGLFFGPGGFHYRTVSHDTESLSVRMNDPFT